MSFVLKALAKATASAAAGGLLASQACAQLNINGAPATSAVVAGSVSAFLYYCRVWLQGYYFDRRCLLTTNLAGKVALVTGCTVGGLGHAGAAILASMGCTLVVTARSDAKGKAAVEALRRVSTTPERISYVLVEFASNDSVRACAQEVLKKLDRLDFLVLNAGIGRHLDGPPMVWQINQLGPFLFTELLTPLLTKTAKAHDDGVRVVAVSSGAHKRAAINHDDPHASEAAYGQSKLAQVMHLKELQRRMRLERGLEGEGRVRCVSVTPGMAHTNLTAPPLPLRPLFWYMARSAHVGAQVIKMACIDPDVPGGAYLSNCYVKPSEGKDGCSNDPTEWAKLWALCEKGVQEAKHSR